MFYYLYLLSTQYDSLSFLRLFKYVTFRAGGAALSAFLLTYFLGPITIRLLKKFQATAPGHFGESHPEADLPSYKKQSPNNGRSSYIVLNYLFNFVLGHSNNSLVKVFLCLLISLGLVGFIDDYKKVIHQNNLGLPAYWKFLFQIVIALVAVCYLHRIPETGDNLRKLMIPLFKHPVIENMWLWSALLFSCTVVVAASNAVNLSDGLDGLAIGCTIICAITYAVFTYLCGHKIFAIIFKFPLFQDVVKLW